MKRLKTTHANPKSGYHHMGLKNEIKYYSYVGNQASNMIMPISLRKNARTGSIDFVYRGEFETTYSAV